ncbi:baseplate assembly protein [Chromobacterium haemolyticum]|uniref:baseplate assembly protein n=1 Tax=Chromobacterium haemolyticum TaxID=394935 RepID=UPI0017479944|nr:baseplate J/gp47 family protein [Chromobacterium haemolyticum]QOD81622.1 baseplate J/gp47 family protein [Chromobacterium haemolyticum]
MIDLTQLPPPDVIEALDFETLFQNRKARLLAAAPAELCAGLAAALQLDSEPLTMLLQEFAYSELLQRQRINEAARASLLAYAAGADLDNRAADYGVQRLLLQPADPDTVPPTPAVWEEDPALRRRCQMALEGLSVAGPAGAYKFHALSASGQVLDASVEGPNSPLPMPPEPGTVRVFVMDRRGDGVPDAALQAAVAAELNDEAVRPICDTVEVWPAEPLAFAVEAAIEWEPGGKSASGGLEGARLRLVSLLESRRRLGAAVARSAIDAALHVAGVRRVQLTAPAADVLCSLRQFPKAEEITLHD